MSCSRDELCRLTATEAVLRLKRGEITPLDLIDAAARRIAEVEPAINALPTLCIERARAHAERLMRGEGREAEAEPGWLAGLPVAIKDLADVAGVRTTYGSPIFRDHVPTRSHPVVERIERKGGIVIAKSNTPEFGAGGSTFNEVFGRTRNPWNTALTSGGSTGGGAAALAAGEVWLAHGSDHAGSLRRPATYCSVVGLRPSPGRVTRGTSNSLFSPLSVQGPMARTVADVALFLDAMAGECRRDPLTFEAPRRSFAAAVLSPIAPKRVAYTADFGGKVPVDRETREICAKAARRFEELGAVVEEAAPDLGNIAEAFLTLRSQHFVVERELMLATHRDQIKPDIIWNTERGLRQSPSELAAAERERAALFRRAFEFFAAYDLLVTPGASTPAFDVDLRMPETVDGKKLENYLGASLITAATTIMALPSVAVPCGFDRYGRPVGLQMVGPHRGEAGLLQAAVLFEQAMGLSSLVPIVPRSGAVPPAV
ncbi:MAG: amidase [Hyphomicrobiales bacterium]|nr:amidase [Hyphomicrobiales bacterium]MBV8827247.1 amidase [Hyphomicrobiales bacterium]MBV9426652.1 amidase [Bradyrhizobiaceae bacterium]